MWKAAAVLVCVWSIATAQSSFAQQPVRQRLANDIDAFVQRILAHDVTPGLALVVVQGDEPLLIKGYGFADLERQRPVTPTTGFYIGSSTKSFTALTIALLAQRNVFDLDAPIATYLPDLQLAAGLSPNNITLRQLLSHTHGIENTGPVVWRTAFTGVHTNELLLELMKEHAASDAGRNFRYTNIGYNLAGLAVDRVQRDRWQNVMQRVVLDPLGMRGTTAFVSRYDSVNLAMPYSAEEKGYKRLHYAKSDGSMQAAGGLISTANDLAKWLEVQMNGGKLDGRQVFPAAVIAETHRAQVEYRDTVGEVVRTGYGLGWQIGTYNGETLMHHHGGFSAFRAHVSFMPAHRVGVAVMVNSASIGGGAADLIAQYVYDRVLEKPGYEQAYAQRLERVPERIQQQRNAIAQDRARRAARPQTLPYPLEKYAGRYESREGGTMVWSVRDGRLFVQTGNLRSVAEVYDHTANRLRVELEPGSGNVIDFKFENGEAVAMVYGRLEYRRVR